MGKLINIDNVIRESKISDEQRNLSLTLFSAVSKDRENTLQFFNYLSPSSKEEIKPIIKKHLPDFE